MRLFDGSNAASHRASRDSGCDREVGIGTNMITRRKFVKNARALAGGVIAARLTGGIGVLSAASRKKSDIRIDHISFG